MYQMVFLLKIHYKVIIMEITTYKKLKLSVGKGWTENFRGIITLFFLICVIIEIIINLAGLIILFIAKLIWKILVALGDEIKSAKDRKEEKELARLRYLNSPEYKLQQQRDHELAVATLQGGIGGNTYIIKGEQETEYTKPDENAEKFLGKGFWHGGMHGMTLSNKNPTGKLPKNNNPIGKKKYF